MFWQPAYLLPLLMTNQGIPCCRTLAKVILGTNKGHAGFKLSRTRCLQIRLRIPPSQLAVHHRIWHRGLLHIKPNSNKSKATYGVSHKSNVTLNEENLKCLFYTDPPHIRCRCPLCLFHLTVKKAKGLMLCRKDGWF